MLTKTWPTDRGDSLAVTETASGVTITLKVLWKSHGLQEAILPLKAADLPGIIDHLLTSEQPDQFVLHNEMGKIILLLQWLDRTPNPVTCRIAVRQDQDGMQIFDLSISEAAEAAEFLKKASTRMPAPAFGLQL